MSLFVRGDERYIRNMPVVGMTPTMYGFNNLRGTLNPYFNEVQFYNPWTGSMGPSYKPADTINNLMQGFSNNPNYNVIQQNQGVNSSIYNTNNINVGLIGSSDDLLKVRQILDKHFESLKTSSTSITPPVVTPPVVTPPVVDTSSATTKVVL